MRSIINLSVVMVMLALPVQAAPLVADPDGLWLVDRSLPLPFPKGTLNDDTILSDRLL